MNRALPAAEKLVREGFVSGHDFSRADKANKMNRALAPEACLSGLLPKDGAFFRSLLRIREQGFGISQANEEADALLAALGEPGRNDALRRLID